MSETPFSHASTSGEKVRRYLLETFLNAPAGTRLPPVRRIARDLSVSSATVDQVYKQLIREKKIETGVGRGTFVAGRAQEAATPRRYCFALSGALGEDASEMPWIARLNQSLLRAVAKAEQRVVLAPLAAPDAEWRRAMALLMEERDAVDGLILYRMRGSEVEALEEITRHYEAAGKPVVVLPPARPTATGNFVSADLFESARKVGRTWGACGRRNILLLLRESLHYGASSLLQFSGLHYGFLESGRNSGEAIRLAAARESSEEAGFEAVAELLSHTATPPDAIYATADALALGALAALREAGRNVPGDTSVIGATGLASDSGLTRAVQPFDAMAEAVIGMLIDRVEHPGRSVPGEFLPVTFALGDTTTAEENRWLEKPLALPPKQCFAADAV